MSTPPPMPGNAGPGVPQGLALFDRTLRLVASNARCVALLDLSAGLAAPGAALGDILALLARRGDLGTGDAEELARRTAIALTGPVEAVERRTGTAGRVLELHAWRMPDETLTISVADVTERVHAETELARVKLSLEARVEERTATLTRVNAELEIARAKADAANLDKTRFLAAASHDLLQPLNAARLYTATLVERAAGTALDDLAHSIEASLTAVEEIMAALIDISRLDSGTLTAKPAPFPLDEILRKIEVEFGPLAAEKSIRLRLVGCRAAVLTDRLLLGRIVQNLVANAVKYTRPGGRVLVGCRRRGARLRLDVVDTGIGFSREQQGLIFAEFSRLEQGARMAPGLGLGLSIVQRLIAMLGLGLELDSREGHGSRFSIYLPVSRLPAVKAAAEPAAAGAALDLSGLRVLCVDNERPILDAMAGLIGGWGCEVRVARSLRDISRDGLIEGWLPDLVLMDYHLDQTSGLDAVEWLRQNLGGHLKAALLTADRSPHIRSLAEARGLAVITKPVRPAALRAAIGALASSRATQPAAPGG
jgi:signal transduction histidine kinase